MAQVSSQEVPSGRMASTVDDVPGAAKTVGTKILENTSAAIQPMAPINNFSQHICTWAMYSQDMERKIETHHHASRLNEDVVQCVVFDSDGPNARLIGVEYIVSDGVFNTLPDDEKKLWHSHFHEIKEGLWVNPGVPRTMALPELKKLAKTYGKFWLTWQFDRGDRLPLGPPALMMSPQAPEIARIPDNMVQARDKYYGFSTAEEAEARTTVTGPEEGIHPLSDNWKNTKMGWATEVNEVPLKLPSGHPQAAASDPPKSPATSSQ